MSNQSLSIAKIIEDGFVVIICKSVMVSGPFGEKDDQQVFVQKIIPETDQLFVRLSSTGKRYEFAVSYP